MHAAYADIRLGKERHQGAIGCGASAPSAQSVHSRAVNRHPFPRQGHWGQPGDVLEVGLHEVPLRLWNGRTQSELDFVKTTGIRC